MAKKILTAVVTIIFILFIFIFPKELVETVSNTLILWYSKVLPSLFPFCVCIKVLSEIGFPEFLSKKTEKITSKIFNVSGHGSFPFFMGLLAGFPTGAKIVSTLYNKKKLSVNECECLLAFCNNPGPIFVITTVGYLFFNNIKIGWIILFSCISGSCIIGILVGKILKPKKIFSKRYNDILINKKTPTIGNIFSSSISFSAELLVLVGGSMIIFAMIIKMLMLIDLISSYPTFKSILTSGLIEMTTGLNRVSSSSLNIYIKIALSSFLLSFGGLTIQIQTLGVTENIPYRKDLYFFFQIVRGLLTSLISLIISFIFI